MSGILKKKGVLSVIAAIVCILIGLLAGFIVLLCIQPSGAADAMLTILKNFMVYPRRVVAIKYLGNTLVKTAPLLMCALSVCFCYKTGLFNIGAAGQYAVGAGACLYAALAWNLPWYACLLAAILAGAVWGTAVGLLKAYRRVNEVISGIMLNWIALYLVNLLLTGVKSSSSPYTMELGSANPSALLPGIGLKALFSNNKYVTIAIPLAILSAVAVLVIMNDTRFGFELQATGLSGDAAKYAGMNEKKNVVVTLAIGGALAGAGAAFLYLSGYEQWMTTMSSVPAMGFNGIAATFLGGLHPVGTIFSSYFIQHITSGGAYLDRRVYPSQISDLISAIIIYLCGFMMFIRTLISQGFISKRGGEKK